MWIERQIKDRLKQAVGDSMDEGDVMQICVSFFICLWQ
jgi:hypothetical protein